MRLKDALFPLLTLLSDSSVGYELYSRVTGLAALIARALAEVTLDKLAVPELSYFVFQTWSEASLVGRMEQDHREEIWLFIERIFGREYLSSLFTSLQNDVVVNIPREVRWYMEGLLSQYPNEINDLISFPLGIFTMLDTPVSVSVEAIRGDRCARPIQKRREKYLEDDFTMATLRLVANIFAKTFHFPIQPACVVRGGEVSRLSPLELSWSITRRKNFMSIASDVPDIAVGIGEGWISSTLEMLLQLNEKMQRNAVAFDIRALREYGGYTEVREILRLLAEEKHL